MSATVLDPTAKAQYWTVVSNGAVLIVGGILAASRSDFGTVKAKHFLGEMLLNTAQLIFVGESSHF